MNKIDLSTFALSVSAAAYMGLGIAPHPDAKGPEGKMEIDLNLARHNIELLELIWEKTKGNRSTEEDRLIEQLLFEVRMKFVEVQRSVSK